MKWILRAIWSLGICMILFSSAWNPCVAKTKSIIPFNIFVKPAGPIHKGASATIDLKYAVNPDARERIMMSFQNNPTGSYSVAFIDPRDYGDTLSVTTFPVEYDTMLSYSGTFQVTMPDADTIYCLIRVECAGWHQHHPCYFISSGDTMVYLEQFMMPPPPNPHVMWGQRVSSYGHPERDTLTDAQLDTKYEVLLDLRNKANRSIAEKILGAVPVLSKSDICDACYIIDLSLRNIYRLVDEGMEPEFTSPPPWDRRYDAPVDSVLKNEP